MARAASDDSDDEFSQALECSIHFGVLKQPKDLPCQHTFCKDCLMLLVHNNQIKCPLCREVCKLPANGVNGLQNNITVQNILDTSCVTCQKRHKKTTCPCCQQQVCNQCKIQHSSKLQTKITDKKQDLRNMAKALRKISQGLSQNKTRFLTKAAKTESEVKAYITKLMEQLQRAQAQLEAVLNSFIETETERINQCQKGIEECEQEIQAALQRSDEDDTAILGNLVRLSQNITAFYSTMALSPSTLSCKLDGQLPQGGVQVEYKPPQPGSGAPTDLLQYQLPIDYQAIGTPRRVFGQGGNDPGQFIHPTHVAVSPVSGNLVVCDRNNSKVQVFTADGKFIRMFGSKGKTEGNTGGIVFRGHSFFGGITVTYGGKIVVADTYNHCLQVFDEAGEFVRVIGSKGTAPGEFNCPRGLACDHSDQLYICDSNNRRVQVMTLAGSVVRVIAASDLLPADIAVCPNGDLVAADLYGALHVYSAAGLHKATIPCGEGFDVECMEPVGVAVDPHGYIQVTDGSFDTHRVYVMEKSGELVCSFGGEGSSPGQFDCPVGVAVTQDGGIIIVDYGNNRVQIF